MTKLDGVLAVSADLMSGQRLWIRVVATVATVVGRHGLAMPRASSQGS
jgi:hypothetical protein